MEISNVINKRKTITLFIILFFSLFIIFIIAILINKKDSIELNAVVIADDVKLYSKPIQNDKNIVSNLDTSTEVQITDTSLNDNKQWYKVKVGNKKGYILSKDVDYYGKDNANQIIVADFSSHNFKNIFSSKNDVEVFLTKYNISYVYIRAGGRGYGKEGNFYKDEKCDEFKNACEYLGIKYGYYFLDEALNDKEIKEEVKFIDEFMKNNNSKLCTLPIALDVEEHEEKGRCAEIWDARAELVSKLIKKLSIKGYNTILYSNANTCNNYLSSLKTKFWLAYYPEESFIPDYWFDKTTQPSVTNKGLINKMIGWQFTENGVKHVISEGIDLSIFKEGFLEEFE